MSRNSKIVSELLPKSKSHFSREEYWNKFFRYRKDSFEWYAEYEELKHVLNRYIKQNDSILVIGCGNSSLSADLYDSGFKDNTSIDISAIVVNQMIDKYNKNGERNGLKFQSMDVFDLKFSDNCFNVVLDKGTLDAIASDDSNQSISNINKMFEQIDRVIKTYGRYLCVSLLQSHILKELLNWFTTNGNWFIRIQRCNRAEDLTQLRTSEDSLVLPVFLVICTKLQTLQSIDNSLKQNQTLFEVSLNDENIKDKPKRLNTIEEVITEIESLQEFAFIQHYIKNMKIGVEEDIHLDLFDSNDSVNARYTLYFTNYVNKKSKKLLSCGVFIVPQGREVEWLFSTTKGRVELTKQSGCEKLIIVHLNRNHKYSNIDQIKSELSAKVLELLPKNILNSNSQIPYLSIGEDVGKRTVVFEGNSELSGDYVIEEIIINNTDIYRRLIFLNNKNIIQSEAKLKTSKKGKKTVLSVDHKYLSCSHHQIITSGLTLMNNQDMNDSNLLLIGLGGGCLPTYLLNNIQTKINLNIKVIEIDKSMMNIAMQWFELKTSNNSNNIKIEVEIEDGLKYISSRNPQIESYDFIVFDVDSKEINVGMSCPPLPFVEREFLEKVNSLLKERNGIFVLNLVARNQDIKKDVYNQIKSVFNSYFVVDIKQELNEIIFAFSTDVRPNWFNDRDIANKINSISKHCFYIPLLKDRYIDLCNSQLKAL